MAKKKQVEYTPYIINLNEYGDPYETVKEINNIDLEKYNVLEAIVCSEGAYDKDWNYCNYLRLVRHAIMMSNIKYKKLIILSSYESVLSELIFHFDEVVIHNEALFSFYKQKRDAYGLYAEQNDLVYGLDNLKQCLEAKIVHKITMNPSVSEYHADAKKIARDLVASYYIPVNQLLEYGLVTGLMYYFDKGMCVKYK